MAATEATLSLVFRARNLANAAVAEVRDDLDKVATKATSVAGKFAGAFAGMGDKLANGIGMATETLAQGGSWTQALTQVGVFMAGQLAETFGGQLLEKIAGTEMIASLVAPLAGVGTSIGGFISAAIPIGMAALPFILVAAIVAAIAVLIVNEDIRNKVIAFAGGIVDKILTFLHDGLAALVGLLVGVFGGAFQAVVDGVAAFVDMVLSFWMALPGRLLGLGAAILETIIGGLSGLPGRVADIVRDAFAGLHIDIGPFHITGSGVTVDLPKIDVPHFAGGVQGFGGGVALVGERGPELVRLPRGVDVIPNHQLLGDAGGAQVVIPVLLDGREVGRIVDERLYYRRQRSPAGGA
jgi:hypothetical protein